MSTLAAWLFIALGVLLLAMIVVVVIAGVGTLRKGNVLRREVRGLSSGLGQVVGSVRPPDREDGTGR
jgi:hypothetical protein